jgi:dihydropteroate synthase
LVPSEFDAWLVDTNRLPLVMGVLNLTPDSFSDGGNITDPGAAADVVLAMSAAGADMIDIGGESTRPGAVRVGAEEQIRRIVPAIRAIRQKTPLLMSVDTTHWAVAEAALDAGADFINDISGGREDPNNLTGAARRKVPIILMHMQGEPRTMQDAPTYGDVTMDVRAYLSERLAAAMNAGVERHRVLLDPGIGFGKKTGHSLALLRDLAKLGEIGQPLVIGASRKSFIGRVLNQPDPLKRIHGGAAVTAWAVTHGAGIVRVHDVGPMSEVVRMISAIISV